MLERHQYYEKNKAAILADVKRIGAHATAKKWKVPGASLYHVLQRWKRESKQAEVKEKPRKEAGKRKTQRGRNYEHLPGVRKHQYFEQNKDAIIADLFILGRSAVRAKWGVSKSGLAALEKDWLTLAEKDKITAIGAKLAKKEPIKQFASRLPAFPEFSPDWDPTVQVKWLEIYEKLVAGAKNVKESTDPTRADH